MGQYSVVKATGRTSVADLKAMGAQLRPSDEARRLEAILEPATDDQINKAISWLFRSLPLQKVDGDDEERAEAMAILREGYMIALRGQPMWAIVEARDAFIGGRVEGYASSFAPNSADLGREVVKRSDLYTMKLGRAKRSIRESRQQQSDGEHSGPLSDATRELARAAIERLKAASAAQKATVSDEPDKFAEYRVRQDEKPRLLPLTAEDVAHVPDAPKRGMQRVPVPSFEPFTSTIRTPA